MSGAQSFFKKRFRRLFSCSAADFTQAGIEVGIVCFSAFLPIWLGVIVLSVTTIVGSVWDYTASVLTSGEVLLIACGIIGPLIYVITRKYGRLEEPLTLRFPYSAGLSILILLIWLVASVVFVLQKMAGLGVLSANVIDGTAILILSLIVTVGSVVVLYFATVFRNSMDRGDAAGMMHNEQEAFVREFTNG